MMVESVLLLLLTQTVQCADKSGSLEVPLINFPVGELWYVSLSQWASQRLYTIILGFVSYPAYDTLK